jgi:sortase A
MRFNSKPAKIITAIGVIAIAYFSIAALINYSYYGETRLAKAIESTRHLVDTLDGEINDPTNPEIYIDQQEVLAATSASNNSSAPASTNVIAEKRQGPDRLIIGKLGVNAYVQHVGIARSGNMAVPSNYKDVAWYKLGSKPGEAGNAVIAGHLDNSIGLGGVFKDLHKLVTGDLIEVRDADGTVHKYRVTTTKSYDYNTANTDEVFIGSEKPQLVLITCSGSWISSQRSYAERFVVFAELI